MMAIKKYLLFTLFFLIGIPLAGAAVVDDFEQYPVGKFPSSWRTWPFQRGKATSVYIVREENKNKFLAASDSQRFSVQILRDFNWNVKEYPVLSWQWRARTLPAGADETNPEKNDSACGVYVVMSKARQEMMKYTWSTTKPVGTVYEKRPGKAYIIVADTGAAKLSTWQTRKINVLEEYKKYFGKEMDKNPAAIAILTDGNATNSDAKCDYDNFTVEKKQ